MKDLRLLQVLPSLESGGAEQGTIDVANYIAHYYGYKSMIVSNGGKMLGLLNRAKIQHIIMPTHSKNPLVILKNINRIRKLVQQNKINLVHVRSRAPAWSVYYACNKICKTVSTFHNVYSSKSLIKRFYNKGLSRVNKIVAISEYVKTSIVNIYEIKENKIIVINRGVDTNLYDPNIYDENKYLDFYYKYNLPNDKKIIFYPGRLTSWKGQIEFLEILESLDTTKLVCYFVGDDKNRNYSTKLEREINKRNLGFICKILGHISSEEMCMMYKSANVVISAPLKPEGFGRIISEALAMKKIVLSYNYGGAKEQISELDHLFSVTPNNKDEMAKKINMVLELSEDKIYHMGEISRNLVKRKFSKKTMLDKYLQFYQEVIE